MQIRSNANGNRCCSSFRLAPSHNKLGGKTDIGCQGGGGIGGGGGQEPAAAASDPNRKKAKERKRQIGIYRVKVGRVDNNP